MQKYVCTYMYTYLHTYTHLYNNSMALPATIRCTTSPSDSPKKGGVAETVIYKITPRLQTSLKNPS